MKVSQVGYEGGNSMGKRCCKLDDLWIFIIVLLVLILVVALLL